MPGIPIQPGCLQDPTQRGDLQPASSSEFLWTWCYSLGQVYRDPARTARSLNSIMMQKYHTLEPLMETPVYKLSGLRIASDFPLFGLEICEATAQTPCDVRIRRATIPEEVASATARFLDGRYSGSYNGKDLLLSRAVGRFLLRAGEEILIDLPPSSRDDEVRSYLLGAVFGALCHQRGITPLHASAIDLKNGCVAFLGPSGAGKSTLVAALAQRGHEIISDDGCFLKLSTNGNVDVWPGVSGIRLCEDARAALGFNGPGAKRAMQGDNKYFNKYFLPIRPPRNRNQARRLRGVYQLHRVPGDITEVARLRGADAVEAVMHNIYPPGLAGHLGYHSQIFALCAAVAQDVPVFRLSRPSDLADLPQGIESLESHLRRYS
jgi:hypothetical protein